MAAIVLTLVVARKTLSSKRFTSNEDVQQSPLETEFATDLRETPEPISPSGPQDARPNIVLINLDDAERDLLAPDVLEKYLPNFSRLAKEGLSFTNCHVTSPLCGPSRTCLLYSQHAHRTGVRANQMTGALNNGYEGGYGVLQRDGIEQEHLGAWMQQAGYRTMAVGKYLHDLPSDFAAPGWDEILMSRGDRYNGTSYSRARGGDPKMNFNSTMTEFRTDYEAAEVESMLRLHKTVTLNQRKPFFCYITPMAPHEPSEGQSMIAPRHRGKASDAQLQLPLSFDEQDFSDKTPALQSLARLGRYRTDKAHNTWQRRIEALMSVDEMLQRIEETLIEEDELDNTLILLTSDHGYLLGHHRMFGKQVPFNRVTNVPLIVWSSKIAGLGLDASARTLDHLVSHLDLAPTLCAVAGTPCERSDGASFAKLFDDPAAIPADQWREDLLIQNFERKRVFDEVKQCAYTCLRTRNAVYVDWANGDREYYDLVRDPEQLDNAWDDLDQSQVAEFESRLRIARRPTTEKATEPTVTLSRATPYEPFAESVFEISGIAEDDAAVEEVVLSIEHPVTKKFWNGDAWKSESVFVKATLGNPGGILSTWRYELAQSELGESDRVRRSGESAMRRWSFGIDRTENGPCSSPC